ncbi:MAG: hydroxymethylpyrimidine/phosphomethylpyrimidine kinase [Acidobacteriota bacterium]|jgi:hydroxymethylpyrimidine kinase/phosphomethylpyrimidine kinase|nr:hydroxymethylpyrimidine/phosphomethylpyrimidine kinase [Acidobacteriota bacterium]
MTIRDSNSLPVALTIAGFDPSGGAGVVADIKTFTAFDCFAVAAITSLTFQNTVGVFGAAHQTAETVRAQVMPVIQDFDVAAAKTGMLPTREVIAEVARLFRETGLPAPVVDPVIRSTSGYDLIDDDALSALVKELMPLARVVTPNIPEAERITGLSINNEEGMRCAARHMREMGARAVLVKGGHLKGIAEGALALSATDVLDDEGRVMLFQEEWIETTSTHGTGCALSAAIAACLGRKLNLEESIKTAKRFVTDAIRHAPGIGHGHSPVNAVISDK